MRKHRFGRQPFLWRLWDFFTAPFKWLFKKRYRLKKGVPPLGPKKSVKADIRRFQGQHFAMSLVALVMLSTQALEFKWWEYMIEDISNVGSGANTAAVKTGEEETTERKVLSINPEQIESLINAEAFTHAVWPGYKGDIKDGVKVRNHFAQNLAKYIINSGGVNNLTGEYVVHFYYVVRDDGAIQFLSLVNGGRTTEGTPKHLIFHAQDLLSIGVPGIKPGTRADGKPITVVYELSIRFKPNF